MNTDISAVRIGLPTRLMVHQAFAPQQRMNAPILMAHSCLGDLAHPRFQKVSQAGENGSAGRISSPHCRQPVCRRYGVRPFRYPRQRSTTIMVRAPRRFFDTVGWRQFSELHTDLWLYFEQTTERLIREAIHADTADAETAVEPAGLR